jgi:oligopeptide transport system substrate-binding protein
VTGTEDLPAHGGFLPPAMPGHSHDLALPHDLERARSLLAEAGYPEGRGLPELRLVHADPGLGENLRREVEDKRAPQWRELGVRLRQEWVPFDDVPSEVQADNTFWEWGWVSDYPEPEGMLQTFLDTQPVLRDDVLLSLCDQARTPRSRDARLELYRAADKLLVAELVSLVPLSYSIWHILHRPHVHGMWAHPMGTGTLDDVVVRRSP